MIHPNRYSSDAYVRHLRSHGCSVGRGTYFFNPVEIEVDVTRPHLIEIGEYCKITSGVRILSHDHSRSVLRTRYGDLLDSAQPTVIGDNVFIGVNAIILPGVSIGSNVVIGAGAVVASDVPGDVVAAGNPCRVLMSLEEFRGRRVSQMAEDARAYARRIQERTGRPPSVGEMGDFFPLYYSGSVEGLLRMGVTVRCNGDDRVGFEQSLRSSSPRFADFDSFLSEIHVEGSD